MAERNGVNIANGVLSAIVLACGIVYSVLMALLFNKVVDILVLSAGGSSSSYGTASSPFWAVGFAYIVPGLIGLIATLTKAKCGYITEMVFYILTLVIMGIVFAVAFISLTAMSLYNYGGCEEVAGQCVCNSGTSLKLSIGQSCADITSLTAMAIGSTAMIVLGWIFALAACITGGILACSNERQPGVIIGHGQPAMVQMGTVPQAGYAQPQYVVQGGYAQPQHVPQGGYAYKQHL